MSRPPKPVSEFQKLMGKSSRVPAANPGKRAAGVYQGAVGRASESASTSAETGKPTTFQ